MIGVYDSGYGGLSVLRALRAALPHHDFVYLGDNGRAPYGGRDVHTILDFAEQAVERLFEEGCQVIVVACHTVSTVALRHLQRRCAPDRRILGVTIPAAECAIEHSRGHIGFIATHRTVASGVFPMEVAKLGDHRVTQQAAPLLAGIVEEGWEDTNLAREAVVRYLEPLQGVDTVVLGCTHYPFLLQAFRDALPAGTTVIDPAPYVALRLVDWLKRHPDLAPPVGTGRLRLLCTGDPLVFASNGARFLGEPIAVVETIGEIDGRLAHRLPSAEPTGQVVR